MASVYYRASEARFGAIMFAIQKPQALLRILRAGAALLAVLLTCSTPAAAAGDVKTLHEARALKITVLVTNVAGDPHQGDGEWGYSALVEVDGQKILYDTGASSDMVLKNAKALHVDLSDVEEVVLSHNHWDHVGGLMALRREFSKANPRAMSRVHVGAGIFEPRLNDAGEDDNGLTGPVPRPNAEK